MNVCAQISVFLFFLFLTSFDPCLFAKETPLKKENLPQKNSWGFISFFPDFETGLLRENRSSRIYRKFFNKKKMAPHSHTRCARLEILKGFYESAVEKIRQNTHQTTVKIPRVIHQIWLGSEVPKKYKEWMDSWARWHGWEYKLWTDKEVAEIQLFNQEAYDRALNYGEKSDILRLEILYLVGGLYADVDFKCVEPRFFDLLHRTTDFYIGIEPLEHELLRFGNCLMGSVPGHPFLAKVIENLSENSRQVSRKNTLDRTGPRYITRSLYEYMDDETSAEEVNLFLPSVTFFPYNGHELFDKDVNAFPPLRGTAAIHYWTGSWALPIR